MNKSISILLLFLITHSSQAATLTNRWSFDTDTTDSVGGNTGILVGGATVDPGRLALTGLGTGTTANHMAFTTPLEIGVNFGATGITIESWYTDTGTGSWGKLFQFGNNAVGQEIAYTHSRGNGEQSGVDRDGAKLFGEQISQNEEHHLVISISSDGNLNAWVDGVQKLTETDTNDLANVTSDFESIGATSWNDFGMAGSVNEFRIWEGALTAFEVEQSFNAGPDALPNFGDTDGDGIQDAWELAQTGITDLTQLNGTLTGPGPGAGTGDFDGDGLFDLEEFQRNTDPTDPDTDDDDLLDGAEVKTHSSDPLLVDTDGDTLNDGIEVNTHGTDPTLRDTDMDFYDDNVELENGTSAIDANDPGLFAGTELTHRWSFTTGDNPLVDSVGGNTAVFFGDPEFTGNQIIFDGLETGPEADSFGFTNLIDLGNNFGSSGVSIESWYTDAGSGGWAKLFAFGNGQGASNIIFNLQEGDTDISSIQYTEIDNFNNGTRPSLNEEHHLALTITPSGEVNAWIDGVHMNTDIPLGDGTNLKNIPATWERVGASAWGDAAMAGSVNEFRIYKGTLTSTDVANSFAGGPDSLAGGEGLSITSITRDNATGAVTLVFKSIPGHTYRIDSSPTLVPADSPQWIDVDDSFFATEKVSTFIDNAATGTKLFYRIQDVTNN
jgi:hypothetical protein